MSFEFEYLLNYPLMGCTGFDVDDTLLLIRTIEANKDAIANDEVVRSLDRTAMEHVYRVYSATVLDLDKINMEYFVDAIELAYLHS